MKKKYNNNSNKMIKVFIFHFQIQKIESKLTIKIISMTIIRKNNQTSQFYQNKIRISQLSN